MKTALKLLIFIIMGGSVITSFANKKASENPTIQIARAYINDTEVKDPKEDFKDNLSNLKEEVGGVPWAGVIVLGLACGGFLIFVLVMLGKMAWILIASPLLSFLIYFILFTAGLGAPGTDSWINGLFSPYRLFSGSGEWIGIASWIIGGLAAGLFLRDTFKGMMSAGVIALFSWGWKVFPSNGIDLILNSQYNECYQFMSKGDKTELAVIGIILIISTILGTIPGSGKPKSRKRRRPAR